MRRVGLGFDGCGCLDFGFYFGWVLGFCLSFLVFCGVGII